MKTITLLKFPLLTLLISSGLSAAAQQKAPAYAITADTIGGVYWNVVRQIDLNNGSALNQLTKAPAPAAAAVQAAKAAPNAATNGSANLGRVAACAFDNATHRLFFATMQTNELYAVNLNASAAPFKVADLRINDANITHSEQNNISRMVIGADGNGYALTNDAKHFFSFSTTGQQVQFRDLGALTDAPENGQNSIHSFATGWGGDMIADKYGFLYVINIYNRVFKIDVNKKEATFTGIISGLPAGFYTNGAAVDDDGKVLLSCSTFGKGYYVMDINSLAAQPAVNKNNDVYNASDLASANLLFQDKNDKDLTLVQDPRMEIDGNISIWPNPVPAASKTFNVVFNTLDKGDYMIQLVDMDGNVVVNKPVRIASKRQSFPINYTASVSNGLYMVRLVNNKNITQTVRKIFIL